MRSHAITASLMDRIFWDNDDPRITPGRVTEATYIASAVRDLQDLLNTRNTRRNARPPATARATATVHDGSPSAFQKQGQRLVDSSVIMAGVPDFSSLSLARSDDRERLAHEITYAIETFDRRFSDVRVELVDTPGTAGSLSFVIRARLQFGGLYTTVGLEAHYESSRMQFTVMPPGFDRRPYMHRIASVPHP